MRLTALSIAALAALASPALASSDDAWAEFEKDVAGACLKAAEPMFESATARVDPFGSESYGLALLSGKAKGADAEIAASRARRALHPLAGVPRGRRAGSAADLLAASPTAPPSRSACRSSLRATTSPIRSWAGRAAVARRHRRVQGTIAEARGAGIVGGEGRANRRPPTARAPRDGRAAPARCRREPGRRCDRDSAPEITPARRHGRPRGERPPASGQLHATADSARAPTFPAMPGWCSRRWSAMSSMSRSASSAQRTFMPAGAWRRPLRRRRRSRSDRR